MSAAIEKCGSGIGALSRDQLAEGMRMKNSEAILRMEAAAQKESERKSEQVYKDAVLQSYEAHLIAGLPKELGYQDKEAGKHGRNR